MIIIWFALNMFHLPNIIYDQCIFLFSLLIQILFGPSYIPLMDSSVVRPYCSRECCLADSWSCTLLCLDFVKLTRLKLLFSIASQLSNCCIYRGKLQRRLFSAWYTAKFVAARRKTYLACGVPIPRVYDADVAGQHHVSPRRKPSPSPGKSLLQRVSRRLGFVWFVSE